MRRARKLVWAPAAVLIGLACAGLSAKGRAASGGGCPATPGQRTLDLVNAEREANGLRPLEPDTLLVRAARVHADDMARRGVVSHDGGDGSDPSQRVSATGYQWIWVGENLAAGQSRPEDVVGGWMCSDAHRHNILSPDFTSAGVAHAESSVGEWGTYWVMVYAASDPASTAVVPCHP
jgi:uncharacterized protein YkwD